MLPLAMANKGRGNTKRPMNIWLNRRNILKKQFVKIGNIFCRKPFFCRKYFVSETFFSETTLLKTFCAGNGLLSKILQVLLRYT